MIFKNPYRDIYTGPGYLELLQRQQTYARTYDNDERDRNRAPDFVDIFDSSGDAAVGANMRFQADPEQQTHSTTRFNGTEEHYSKLLKLSFVERAGKVTITQYADGDGNGRAEVHRSSVVDKASGRLESQVDHLA